MGGASCPKVILSSHWYQLTEAGGGGNPLARDRPIQIYVIGTYSYPDRLPRLCIVGVKNHGGLENPFSRYQQFIPTVIINDLWNYYDERSIPSGTGRVDACGFSGLDRRVDKGPAGIQPLMKCHIPSVPTIGSLCQGV
jgi:hypothetical protein